MNKKIIISSFCLLLILVLNVSLSQAKKNDERSISISDNNQAALSPEELEYKILKLEAKFSELYAQINSLSEKLKVLDKVILEVSHKVEGKEVKEGDDSGLNANEFFYGFNMLKKGHYDIAKKSFELFLIKYPKDKKVGEVYFWLGDIAYVEKNYKLAAKKYLISYKDHPIGPKRNEALYKLSLSLNNLGKRQEACGGLQILVTKGKGTSASLRNKSLKKLASFGCRAK